MPKINAIRYHDFCMGHRVVGHEGKCRNLHGHNYRIHLYVEADELDHVGRVIDFSVIKSALCEWIEESWDHKFMMWKEDPFSRGIMDIDPAAFLVPFNPTAENISRYFCDEVAPVLLDGLGVKLTKVTLEETRKCSVDYIA